MRLNETELKVCRSYALLRPFHAGGDGSPVWCRGGSRTARRSRHPKRIPKPNDNCPLRHRRASPYIGCIRHSRAEHPSFPRRRSGPSPLRGEGGDEGAPRPRADDRQWNEMEQNGTELKVCRSWPLVMRPPQSKQGHAGPPRTSERSANQGHTGLIFSLSVRSK